MGFLYTRRDTDSTRDEASHPIIGLVEMFTNPRHETDRDQGWRKRLESVSATPARGRNVDRNTSSIISVKLGIVLEAGEHSQLIRKFLDGGLFWGRGDSSNVLGFAFVLLQLESLFVSRLTINLEIVPISRDLSL